MLESQIMAEEEETYFEKSFLTTSIFLGAGSSSIVTELLKLDMDGFAALTSTLLVLIASGYLLSSDHESSPRATARHGVAMTGGLILGTIVSEIASQITDNPYLGIMPTLGFTCLTIVSLIINEFNSNKNQA